MQHNDQNQENLTRLRIRGTQNRVQIAKQEEDRPEEPHTDKRPVQRRKRTPTHKRHGNPDQIRVSVQRPALDQVSSRAAEPAQRAPQRDRQDTRVAVDQAGGAGEEGEVVGEVVIVVTGEPLRDGTS